MPSRGKLLSFCPAWITEIAELALFDRTILQLHGDLRWPARFAFGYSFHHADGAGDPMNEDFAEITFAGGRYFQFAHADKRSENSGAFNGRMAERVGSTVPKTRLGIRAVLRSHARRHVQFPAATHELAQKK